MSDINTQPEQPGNPSSTDSSRIQELEKRIQDLKEQNQELTTQLAETKQQKETMESRVDRLSRENKKLKQHPNFVATVQECLPNNEVLIQQHGNNQEAVTAVTPELYESIEPDTRVAIDNSLNIVKTLESETDVRAQVMEVTESPNVSYDDIGGLTDQLRQLRESVEMPLVNPEKFEEVGVDPPTGVLLHGPPGTGKTLLARAVAAETNTTIIQLSGSDLARKFIGEGAKLVRELFSYAREEEPAVIFIDELDAIASERTETKASGDAEVQRTLMQLLNEIDGFEDRGNISIIGATNRLDMIDDAVTRPGRFDRIVEVPEPRADEREEILHIHMRDMNIGEDVQVDTLIEETEGMTGADLKALCTEAGMFALRNDRTEVIHTDFINAQEKIQEEDSEGPTDTKGPSLSFA